MASTRNLQLIAPSSPSSWDVFLSFCGKDTRRNLIAHLYFALDQAGIRAFKDDPALPKGEDISGALLTAIHGSEMFVVVISENYARSSWCLDELVEILGCKKTENQVIPVFYYVDPSDLRHRKGIIGEALDYHKKRYSVDVIEKWENALAAIAKISGYHLKKDANEDESKTIQEIVENIAQVSTTVLPLEKCLPGIDSAVEEIYQKLGMEINHVSAIGICGMGGIGKTTIAKAFYNKYSNRFDISCFLDKVKQYTPGGLLPLLNQVLAVFLRKKDYKVTDVESGFGQLKQSLFLKKALIVLDDLDQSSYSEFLVRLTKLFSAGSRIIITTRDVHLLNQLKTDKTDISDVDTYMVKKLGELDSLELFSYHAFGTPTPPADLRVLSESFVTYAGGLPLALKVLGSSLHGRTHDVLFWKAKLEKVKEIPENEILKILQLSYDELGSDTEKALFLDIAFFFIGKYEFHAVEIFKSCAFFPEVGIKILVERCLLEIGEDQRFQMHDLVQDMGRELAKSTHLFWRGNALWDLQNQEEPGKIEVLILDLTLSKEKLIDSKIFERLPRLRLLEISNAHGTKGNFRNSFHELRCIYWSYCTWKQLPSSFRPQKLVSLIMPYSNFKILWDGAKPLMSLKTLNVAFSVNLKMTPDFGKSKLVERLEFRGCEGLLKFHPSIKELTGLSFLNLRECTHLKELGHLWNIVKRSPEPMKQWANMRALRLGQCSNLRRLPHQLGDMTLLYLLDASSTAIEELPDSITQLRELVDLNLSNCKKLRKLPDQIGNMQGLRNFKAGNIAIEQLPESFACLINLERLDLRCCKNLRNLPNSIWKLKLLKVLNLEFCSQLERLPEELGEMESLEELNASDTAIEEVPESIGLLSRLQILDLSWCEKLKYLPNGVWNLTSLTSLNLLQPHIWRTNLSDTVKYTKLVTLSLNYDIRLWLPMIQSFSSLETLSLSDEGDSLSTNIPFSLSELYNLHFLQLYKWTSFGSSFPELPPNLTHLSLCDNATLVHLPDLSSLKQLKNLYIIGYYSLESLPPLPPYLQSLTVYYCRSLQDQADMSMLKELKFLNFGMYVNPVSVSLKKSFLQVRRQSLPSLKANVPKIAEWFSYKSSGRILSFDVPPLLGDKFLGLALWVLFTSKTKTRLNIKAVVTNKTNGTSYYYLVAVICSRGAEGYSAVRCTSADEILIRSGDTIKISFERQLYSSDGQEEVNYEEVKWEMCGANVIQKTPITPAFPSVLNNLINLANSKDVFM